MIITGKNITKEIDATSLFQQITFHIDAGDKIGLIGDNGVGKTTLLRMIAQKDTAYTGALTTYIDTLYIPQLIDKQATASGGEQKMTMLNKAFATHDTFLLLDEPTTNLDYKHIDTLIKRLKRQQTGFMLITHDRKILDMVCTSIWEVQDQSLTIFKGNYASYIEQKQRDRQAHQKSFERYEQKKSQLEQAIVLKDKKAANATKMPKNLTGSEASASASKPYFAKKQKKLARVSKGMERRLEQLEQVEQPKELVPVKMDIPSQDMIFNKAIITATKLRLSIDEKILVEEGTFTINGGEKVAIIGANGVGKTTLVQLLMQQTNDAIQISPRVKFGYYSQNLDILDEQKTMYENVAETSKQQEAIIRTVLNRLLLNPKDMTTKVKNLSGGQQVKVALAKVFLSDMNVLVLDEPTNYLDLLALEGLETLLQQYEGTLIMVSHDETFVHNIATKVIRIADKKIHVFEEVAEAYEKIQTKKTHTAKELEEKLLVIDMQISALIGELSLAASAEKEQALAALIEEKQKLQTQ